ncbi:tripartite tricarboxylate transporter TctB family protein [Roseivivax isoporae]|nr:tripartite tricarboxylate transporter TctB family protein [Roseivivax isoporae]
MTPDVSMMRARARDLWAGLGWMTFGAAIAAHATSMPIPRHLGATTITGPGLLPFMLGTGLALLGAILVLRSVRGQAVPGPDDEADPATVSNRRSFAALVLMFGYAAAFALRQPFVLCTVIFIWAFVILFNWREAWGAARLRLVAGALVLALAVGFSVEFVFENLFYVRLP